MLRTILFLIHPIIIELRRSQLHRLKPFPLGNEIDFEHDIPPCLFEGGVPGAVEVVVPHLLRKNAKEQGLLDVYGSGWLVEEGETLEQEMIEAEARYLVKPEPASLDEDDCATDDSNSYFGQFCSSDDYCIYSDDECEDVMME